MLKGQTEQENLDSFEPAIEATCQKCLKKRKSVAKVLFVKDYWPSMSSKEINDWCGMVVDRECGAIGEKDAQERQKRGDALRKVA